MTSEHLQREMEQAMVKVTIDSADMGQQIQAKLVRKHPSKGRAMSAVVPAAPLLHVGDRLERSVAVHNPGSADISQLPIGSQLIFYRPNGQNRLRGFCPIFFWNIFYGTHFARSSILGPQQVVGDVLHTWDEGVAARCGGAIWAMFFKNPAIVNVPDTMLADARTKAVLDKIDALLDNFFSVMKACNTRAAGIFQ